MFLNGENEKEVTRKIWAQVTLAEDFLSDHVKKASFIHSRKYIYMGQPYIEVPKKYYK